MNSSISYADDYISVLWRHLVDCAGFQADAKWISGRLGLMPEIAADAWKKLVDGGFVHFENSKWIKRDDRILFPSARIDPRIQKY